MNQYGQIIAIGGGGFGRKPNKPKITFFLTASAENKQYILTYCVWIYL